MKPVFIGFFCLAVVVIAFGFGFGVGHYQWPPAASLTSIMHEVRGAYPKFSQTIPEPTAPHYLARTSLFELLPGTVDVVMVGDSLTEAANWNELLPHVNIANRGIAGDTSNGVRKRLSEVIRRQPKLVFLLVGTNDTAWGLPLEFTIANVAAIIETLKLSKTRLIVQSVPFAGIQHDGRLSQESVRSLNAALERLCSKHGIEFLNLNRILAPTGVLDSRFTSDGIHFSGQGYKAWVDTILPILNVVSNK